MIESKEMGKYAEKGRALHKAGYNCSQCVMVAFHDVAGISEETAINIASGLGGGMAKLRESCGAFTAVVILTGLIYGKGVIDDDAKNKIDYPRIQEFGKQFLEQNGSLSCRTLLGLDGSGGVAAQGRDCSDIIASACDILENYLSTYPVPEKA